MNIGLPACHFPHPPALAKKKKKRPDIYLLNLTFSWSIYSSTNNFAEDLVRETQLGGSFMHFWDRRVTKPFLVLFTAGSWLSLEPSHLLALLGYELTGRKISFMVHLFDQAFTFYVRSLNIFFLGHTESSVRAIKLRH